MPHDTQCCTPKYTLLIRNTEERFEYTIRRFSKVLGIAQKQVLWSVARIGKVFRAYENTRDLLLYNRRRMAEKEVQAERIARSAV